MQSVGSQSSHNQGDGIYAKTTDKGATCNGQLLLTDDGASSESHLDSNHNEIDPPAVANSDSCARVDGILSGLNRELDRLDELKQTRESQQSDGEQAPNVLSFDFTRRPTGSEHSQTSRRSSELETRKFLLDNYIASCIRDNRNTCACRYHLEADDSPALDEFYREEVSPAESTGSCSLQELDRGVDHGNRDNAQQVYDLATESGAWRTVSEYVSGAEIESRKVSTSAAPPSYKRASSQLNLSCNNDDNDGLDGLSSEQTIHYQSAPAKTFRDRHHCKHSQLKPAAGASSLFIDSESVQSSKGCETRANRLGRRQQACLSAPNNQLISCYGGADNIQRAIYAGQKRLRRRQRVDLPVSGAYLSESRSRASNGSNLKATQSFNEIGPFCDCSWFSEHQASSASSEVSSSIDSDSDDGGDLDAIFDTRSALDCVEESPSNQDEFSFLSTSDGAIDYSHASVDPECQLFCSLTTGSASRQNSPTISLAASPDLSPAEVASSFASRKLASQAGEEDFICSERPTRRPSGGPASSGCSPAPRWTSDNPPAEINSLDSSLRLSPWHKMSAVEDNSCTSNHNLCKDGQTTLAAPNTPSDLLAQQDDVEARTSRDGPTTQEAEQFALNNNPCDHERESFDSPTSNGNVGHLAKLRLERVTTAASEDVPVDSHTLDATRVSLGHDSSDCVAGGITQRDALPSMRAAKDLAKLSIPSLSSLQYLPGQMEINPARLLDQHESSSNNGELVESESKPAVPPSRVSPSSAVTKPHVMQQDNEPRKRQVRSDHDRPAPKAASKHVEEDSCLLHRLCLCNCMARPHGDVGTERKRLGSQSRRHRLSPSRLASSLSSSRKKLQEPSASTSIPNVSSPNLWTSGENELGQSPVSSPCGFVALNDEDIPSRTLDTGGLANAELNPKLGAARSHQGRLTSGRQFGAAREKQSFSFLSRLTNDTSPSQVRSDDDERVGTILVSPESHSRKAVRNLGGHQQSDRLLNPTRGSPHVGSDGFGSIGDFGASGRSSSASGTNSGEFSPLLLTKSNERSDESSSCKSGRHSVDILSDADQCGPSKPTKASKPTCEGTALECPCKQRGLSSDQQHKRRNLKSIRRLLNPNRLFASVSTSSISGQESDRDQGKHQEEVEFRSFLSRSLNRLSGRKRGHKQASPSATKGRKSASPDVSLSNHSQHEPTSGSFNSLDDLTHSLPFEVNHELRIHEPPRERNPTRLVKAPQIILSKVEYQDEGRRSCDSMTKQSNSGRAGGHHQHSRNFRATSRNNDNRENKSPPQRYGSELSFKSGSNQEDSDGFAHHGPLSLPSSPRSARQHRHQSRSPRLSHSPVPFHSPASESTKIEDGLRVCSTEHFEKHIGNIKDDQVEAQKRLFAAWINHFSPNLIRGDLCDELRDGIKLIGLLAALTHNQSLRTKYIKLSRDRITYINRLVLSPGGQVKNLSNVKFAIDYLRNELGMRLVNLNAMDIVCGKDNVILGLCWTIILHFQLDRDLLRSSETSSQLSDGSSASHLSSNASNNERAGRRSFASGRGRPDEFTKQELTCVRTKLLHHINKRFNLKLTNLTSSLVDGDVLLAIIKQLLPPNALISAKLSSWATMQEEEKLDCCFELAAKYLNVPKLVTASDLRRQTIGENNTKPLLVYLSMLLKSNPSICSTDQMLELRRLDESLAVTKQPSRPIENQSTPFGDISSSGLGLSLEEEIKDLEMEDKFHFDKLQATIAKIDQIGKILEEAQPELVGDTILERYGKIKRQAEQVEALIVWINKADKLFDKKQKSASELAATIEEYESFFSTPNLPPVDTTLCPTFERQYRECLATARQRVLSMEQTMKNWISYEQARQDLKNWLMAAEAKLNESLRPDTADQSQEFRDMDPISRYTSRLDSLIEFFELEQMEDDDGNQTRGSYLPSSLQDEVSNNSLSNSLSGSLLSLGSNASRFSAVTSSKTAKYGHLFDNFELKCRLLATTLENDQRDSLLIGVRELKSRLKYVIDCKVPQVINELRLSIDRCEMSIKEQDEICSDLEEEARDWKSTEEDYFECEQISDPSRDNNVVDTNSSAESKSETKAYNSETPVRKCKKSKIKDKACRKKSNPTETLKEALVKVSQESSRIDPDDDCTPLYRKLWNKICRASRLSLPLNIVFLICLAGVCIIPLIHKEACCELSQAPVATDRFTNNHIPT